MDKDFHYYLTCTAAMIAGWEKEEAIKIAHSAQFVDDCVPGVLNGTYKHNGNEYGYISTNCGKFQDIVLNRTARDAILMSYHFLPGNFKCKGEENQSIRQYLEYNGDKDGPGWTFREKSFKLLCTTKSCLSEKMVNQCSKHKDSWIYYDLIGICVHVLADTVAHTFFSGESQWSSNEILGDIYRSDHGIDKKILFGDDFEKRSSSGAGNENATYAGHARADHIPDYPHCNYKYIPQWNKNKKENVVFIDNNTNYLLAFKLLVQALYCIKNDITFKYGKDYIDHYKFKGRDIIPAINEAITFDYYLYHNYQKSVNMRCGKFKEILEEAGIDLNGKSDYDPDKIIKDDNAAKSFNYAALQQLLFVREQLHNNDFDVFGEIAGIKEEHVISRILSDSMKVSEDKSVPCEKLIDDEVHSNSIQFRLNKDEIAMLKNIDRNIEKFFDFFKNNINSDNIVG